MRCGLSLVVVVLLLGGAAATAAAQRDDDIARLVQLIDQGKADQAKKELPRLQEQRPNDPGVLYVQALLMTDGSEAVRTYQSIVDNFPKSAWADDALFRVYQFYYALGLYRTAEIKMSQLKKDYPTSRYISQAGDIETGTLPDEEEQPVSAQGDSVAEEEAPVSDVPTGTFTLQVGAFSAQVNAEKQKVFFEDLNMPVEVINRVKDGRSLYVVLVGNFPTADDARAKGAEIRKNYNIESMVIPR
jgi:septal ring-binding cell division protein DamX